MRNLFLSLAMLLLSSSAFSSSTSGITVGTEAPQILAKDINGTEFNLKASLRRGPVVLVFYRGGWCPHCNLQLRKLQKEIVPRLKNHKATLVAISVDKLNEVEKTQKKESLGMTLISDPTAALIKKYQVVNQTSDSLVRTYKEQYNIDLERSSGQTHHIIAIPAVFTIAQDGKVTFAYVNEDYTIRAQNRDILFSLARLKNK